MKSLLLPLLIFLTIAAFPTDRQIPWESELVKIEKDYQKGEYKYAFIRAENLLKKIQKANAMNDLHAARLFAVMAKISEGLGKYEEYENYAIKSETALASASKEDTTLYLKTIFEIALAHAEYGAYAKSEAWLDKGLFLFKNSKYSNPDLHHDFLDKQAFVHYKQGRLLKAESEIPQLIEYRKTRIVKHEPYRDTKGKVKEKKLSKTEREARIRNTAALSNLNAYIAYENGNIDKMDSIVKINANFIRRSLRKKDVSYIDNLCLKGLSLESKRKISDANNQFKKAYKYLSKTKGVKWKNYNKNSIPVQEKLVLSQRAASNTRQSRKRERILNTRIRRYYGKSSPYQGRAILLNAQTQLMQKDYKNAEELAREVLDNKAYSPKNHENRIEALKILYIASLHHDQFERAEGALDQIIDIRKELNGEDAPTYKMALLDLASFQVRYSDKFKNAEELYGKHLKVIQLSVDHRHKDYLDYLYSLSNLYQFTDRFEKATEVLNDAVVDCKKYYGEHNTKYASALARQGNTLIDLGKYSDAEKNLIAASDIFKNESTSYDRQDYSEVLLIHSRLFIIQGQYDEAKRMLKKAINKQTGSSAEVKQSEAIEELATLYIELGEYQDTEKSLKQSLKLKEAKYGSMHRTLVNPLNQLSHLYIITGNYVEAEKLSKRAVKMSATIFGDTSLKFAESVKLLGDLYAAIGDYEKAEDAEAKALEIQKHQYGPNHIQVAMSLNDLAIIKFYNKGSKEEVEDLLNQSLKIAASNVGENNPIYASIVYNLGLLHVETGDIDNAASLLNKANSIWVSKLGENNRHSAKVYSMKGNISYQKHNYAEAKVNYTQSKDIYGKLFDNMHPGYLSSLGRSGQMDFILGNNKEAVKSLNETTSSYLTYIKKYFPSLSEKEKTKFWKNIQKDFEFYNTLALRLKDQNPELVENVYNYALATKAVLLNSSIKVRQRIMDSKDPYLVQKFEEWVAKKEFLTSAISMTADQRKEANIDIKVLEVEIENLEKELSDRSELFAKNFRKKESYEWKDVKKTLAPNEVAVEIVKFRTFDKGFTDTIVYAALIVSPDTKSYPEMVIFREGKDMDERWLRYYRNCMKFNIRDNNSYAHYWKPIREKIPGNSVVYLSADGVFNQINLETIPTSDEKYVIDENSIVLVSNTRDLIARKQELEKQKNNKSEAGPTPNKVALFGNPLYYSTSEYWAEDSMSIDSLLHRSGEDDRKVNQLPGAEKEVKNVDSLVAKGGWNSEIYLNENATEQKIKELNNIKVFHIATHGFFKDNDNINQSYDGLNENRAIQNPLLTSGLLLKDGGHLLDKENVYEYNSSDGILTAYEAMNLNFDNCELVVLSACETGLGKVESGEGVFGLQRAFLVAGAKTVIMSLFKVNDEVTQELMTEFYKRWIDSGDKRKSFLEAKKVVKQKYKKPIYWGSFIMIGIE